MTARTHLAVLYREYIDRILAGEKTIESRLSMNRVAPYGKIEPGHTIYFKQSGGPIRAIATAGRIETFTDLTPERIDEIRKEFNHGITGDDEAWAKKRHRRYGTLIWLDNVRPTSEGPVVGPLYGAAWVCNPEQRAKAVAR